jgi:hypothetical protein
MVIAASIGTVAAAVLAAAPLIVLVTILVLRRNKDAEAKIDKAVDNVAKKL